MGFLSGLFGGGESKSVQNPATVWDKQAPYLTGLYQLAQRRMNFDNGRGIPGLGQALGQRIGMPGHDPLSQLGGQLLGSGIGMTNQLGMLGQVGNPFAMGQIGQLGQGLGRLFEQQIAPTIGRQFAGGGTYGSDRQALALGQAGEGIGQQFTMGALDILGNSAGLALSANQAGLGSLGSLFGLGNAALFGSLPGYQSILGPPTVLAGGGSSSSSNTGGIIPGLGNLFGGLGGLLG